MAPKGKLKTKTKLVAVGDGAVGKTSLLMVLSGKEFPERYVPTIFENYLLEKELDGAVQSFDIWDTAGQDEYDRLRPLSYESADCILMCFAFDSISSFENLTSKWLVEVRYYCKGAKIVVVGGKLDLRDSNDPSHVTDAVVEAFVARNKLAGFVACSAKTKMGIDRVLPMAVGGKKPPKSGCLLL